MSAPAEGIADRPSSVLAWAQLVRLPNVFTIVADVTAAFLLSLGGSGWVRAERFGRAAWSDALPTWFVLLLAAISLYWGGMVLNDVCDVRRDARSRASRPLPRRWIRYQTAHRVAWVMLAMGVLLASILSTLTGCIAVALVIAIVAYDGPCKRMWIAPLLMGLCRVLSFSMGAAAGMHAISPTSSWQSASLTSVDALGVDTIVGLPLVTCVFAIGMGTYIAGITTFARREAIGDRTIHLSLGLLGMSLGAAMLALAPRMGNVMSKAWQVDAATVYPIAIVLMLAPTLRRAWVARNHPSPKSIQQTIRSALLAIIPLAAAIAMLAAGALPGLAVLALWLPSQWLARRFAVT